MRIAVTLAALLVWACAPAHAVSETAEGFSAAMQGCWNQTEWSAEIDALAAENGNSLATQMCLDGGIEGTVTMLDCHTHGDLTECSTSEGRYAFRDEKVWRDFDGVQDSCDVFLQAAKSVTLKNCVWIDPPPAVEPINDAVFERAIGQ